MSPDSYDRNAATLQALVSLAHERPLRVRVAGHCMAPLVQDGAIVEIEPARFYWPGDVLALARSGGQLVLHRVLGYRPTRRGYELITRGDATPLSDAPVAASRVLGRVRGGDCAPSVVRIPLRHRLWAVLSFVRLAISRLA
jgi:hypothetical protein